MTEGEKMVWAAMYAVQFHTEYEKRGKYGDRYKVSVPSCIEWAWSAVNEMREARQEMLDGWGEGEELEMLDEIIGRQ